VDVGTRVRLTDARGTHEGVVTSRRRNGMCVVEWDSGVSELIHQSELTEIADQPAFKRELQKLWDRMRGAK